MLRRTGTGWQFENEAILEDCLQRHLEELLGLKPLKQQHYINGQICDLIAVSKTGQGAVLELKNGEDRYIAQQLTRYFDAIAEVKPFQDSVDYTQSIRLLAIAPSFHRDTFIDLKHNQLSIELLTFQILELETSFLLKLYHLGTEETKEISLAVKLNSRERELPAPPKLLLNALAKCPGPEREGVLALRQQLLSFDSRMKEITGGCSILYGRGKSNPCAELRYDSQREKMALFLWLPHKTSTDSQRFITARLRIWTDWSVVSDLAHIPEALGRTITVEEWLQGNIKPLSKVWPKDTGYQNEDWKTKFILAHRGGLSTADHRYGIAMTFDAYQKVTGQMGLSNQLIAVTQLALERWLSSGTKLMHQSLENGAGARDAN